MLIRNFALRTIASNRFGIVEVLSRLLNWATLPIAGLLIDPAWFGQVVLLSTAISILTTVGTFGQQRTILHYAEAQAYQSYGAIVIAMAYAMIIVLVGFLGLAWFQGSMHIAILLVSLLTILHLLLSTQRRAFEDVKGFAFLRLSLSTSRLVLVLGALVTFDEITAYIAAEVLAIILSLTFSAQNVSNLLNEPKELSSALIIKSSRIGAPILLQSVLLMATAHYDKLLLARLGQYEQLGQYGMLYMIATSVAFISSFIGIKYEPVIYQSGSNRAAYTTSRNYQKRLFITQVIAAVAITLIWQFAKPIIMPDNTLAWFVLPLLFGGQVFGQAAIPWSVFLTQTMAFLGQTISVVVAAVASLSLNTLLVPEYGPIGAAFAFLAANTIYFVFIYYAAQLQIKHSER